MEMERKAEKNKTKRKRLRDRQKKEEEEANQAGALARPEQSCVRTGDGSIRIYLPMMYDVIIKLTRIPIFFFFPEYIAMHHKKSIR